MGNKAPVQLDIFEPTTTAKADLIKLEMSGKAIGRGVVYITRETYHKIVGLLDEEVQKDRAPG